MAIFASVRNCAGSKIKMVRPSVKLEDRVILSNSIYNLTVKYLIFFIAIMKIKEIKFGLNFIIIKLLGMSFTRFPT